MIPVFKPALDEEEWWALKEPLAKGWLGLGPKTRSLKGSLRSTPARRMPLAATPVPPRLTWVPVLDIDGGEVITTSLTYVATNHAIMHAGGIPVFADIEDDTGNIRVERSRATSPRARRQFASSTTAATRATWIRSWS